MKNYWIILSVIIISGLLIVSCSKDEQLKTIEQDNYNLLKSGGNLNSPTLNSDGILVFQDMKHLEAFANYLEKEQETGEEYGPEYDDDCMKDDKTLDLFESNFPSFKSFRKHYMEIECQELSQGVDVDDLTETPIPDDVQSTLLNKHGEVIIGDEVYLFKSNSLRYKTDVENINEVKNFRNGGQGNYNLLDIDGLPKNPNGPNGGPESVTCDVNYEIDVNNPAKTVTITWNGSTSANHKVQYDWGDGTTETVPTIPTASKTHTYSTTGSYSIIITVFNDAAGEECSQTANETVFINQLCVVSFNDNAGTNGLYTFTPHSLLLSNGATIQEWQWDFGDGDTETVQGTVGTVSHTYDCEGEYYVFVKVITSEPSCQPQFGKNIQVTNLACVDYNYDSGWSDEVYGSSKKIKHRTWFSNALWPKHDDNKRVKAKMKNYKQKSNGKWKKDKKNLKIVFGGDVYVADGVNCLGNEEEGLNNQLTKKKKKLKLVEDKGEILGTKDSNPFSVEYSVDNQLIFTKLSDDAGC